MPPVEVFGDSFAYKPDSFRFVVDADSFVVTGTGNGSRKRDYHHFIVPLPDSDDYITSLSVAPYQSDLVFTVGYDDGEDGGGYVVRLSPDSSSPRWHANWFGFNVAGPLFRPPYLYVAAIGTVGKIDLATGQYVWRHDDLYERSSGAYNLFDRPQLIADTVLFTSSADGKPRRLLVNDSSGVILSR